MRATGSPGARCTSRNTTTLARTSVGIPPRRRRAVYHHISRNPARRAAAWPGSAPESTAKPVAQAVVGNRQRQEPRIAVIERAGLEANAIEGCGAICLAEHAPRQFVAHVGPHRYARATKSHGEVDA